MARHGWWKTLVFVALFGVCSISTVTAQGTTFTDPQGHFSFTVPPGWQQGSLPQSTNLPPGTTVSAVFNAAPPVNGNFNLLSVGVPANLNLEEIVAQSRAGVEKSIPGYQAAPGGIQSLTLGGQGARRYDYFITPSQGGKLHGAQIITLQANTVYIITLTAVDSDFDTFFRQASVALDSFKFIAGGTGGGTTTLPSTGMPTGAPSHSEQELLVLIAGSALIAAGFVLRRQSSRA